MVDAFIRRIGLMYTVFKRNNRLYMASIVTPDIEQAEVVGHLFVAINKDGLSGTVDGPKANAAQIPIKSIDDGLKQLRERKYDVYRMAKGQGSDYDPGA
jgi:hypothetical protein